MTVATTSAPMLLDWLLPEPDATIVEHLVVDGDPDAVYRAVATVDMVDIPQTYPAVRTLFAARGAAERLVSALLGRPVPAQAPDGPMRLGDLPEQGEWVKLADEPPHELAFGVVGRFWAGRTSWKTIDAHEFVMFDEPGFAKTVYNLSVREVDAHTTLLSGLMRTATTDEHARRWFRRYWTFGVGSGAHILVGALLDSARRAAEGDQEG